MRQERRYWPMYLVLALGFLALAIWPNVAGIWQAGQQDDERYYAGVPDWTFDQTRTEMVWLESQASTPGDTPEAYYEFLPRVYALPHICTKQLRAQPQTALPLGEYKGQPIANSSVRERDGILRNCQLVSSGAGLVDEVQRAYYKKFGHEKVAAAGEALRRDPGHLFTPFPKPEDTLTGHFYQAMYLWSLPFALVFFIIRLSQDGLRLLPELARLWPLPLAVIAWPWRVWVYPNQNLREQLAAARLAVRRWATVCISASLSLCGGGLAFAQTKGSGGAKKDPKRSAFNWAVYGGYASRYVAGIGAVPYDGTVLRLGVHVTHRSCAYADVFSSLSPHGGLNSDFGDELDYTVGCSRTLGPLALDASFGHFDLFPLGRIRGDMRDASLDATVTGTPVKPYVHLDWLLARDPAVLEGGVAWRVGVRPAVKLGRTFNLEVSAGGHDGVFGHPPERVGSARAQVGTTFTWGKLLLTPYLAHQFALRHGGLAPDRTWFGLSLARAF